MKITRDKMFFSKDLIHTMAYVGMFVAAIISVGACKSGIWVAAILACTADELGEALESHLNRYKLSVEQARSVHPEYFTEG